MHYIVLMEEPMWNDYITAVNIDEVLEILAQRGSHARIVAGATDLQIEFEQGEHRDVDTLVDITRISGLDQITLDGGTTDTQPWHRGRQPGNRLTSE
jgi:CO/xanthine dehydrogenase FAD-binding subunit